MTHKTTIVYFLPSMEWIYQYIYLNISSSVIVVQGELYS